MSFYDFLQHDTEAERADLLAQPLFADALAGRVTRPLYRAFLAQAYHHVRHTVPLMMTAGGRLTPDKEWMREKLVHHGEAPKDLLDVVAFSKKTLAPKK